MTIIHADSLYTVLRLRLEEFEVMTTRNVEITGGLIEEYCIWGPMNALREGEFVRIEDLIEFNQLLLTEHELHLELIFNYAEEHPWMGKITKIYPAIKYSKSKKYKEELSEFMGLPYKDIPGSYFSGVWVANEPGHKQYSSHASSFTDLHIYLLLHLVRIANKDYTFPELPAVPEKEKAHAKV